MDLLLRDVNQDDWPAIFQVAMQAVPHAGEENREWWHNRQQIDEDEQIRIHVVAEDENRSVVGYGAIEQGPEADMYRMFIVGVPDVIQSGLGDQLYDYLMSDLLELKPWLVWIQEETLDPIVDFFRGKVFLERTRFTLENSREAIVLYKEIYPKD